MASGLKSDLLELQRVFTKIHERFRILKASADELTCRFVLGNETFCDVQGNITVSVYLLSIVKMALACVAVISVCFL